MSTFIQKAVVVLCIAGVAQASRAVSEEPAVRLEARGAAFVVAMNAPGDEPLAAFVRDHLERGSPPAARPSASSLA